MSGKSRTNHMVLAAVFAAGAIVLAVIEGTFPPVFAAVPGIRLGLSNIAVMYMLFFAGKNAAFSVALIKSGFVLLTRGAVAGALSLAGGASSIALILAVLYLTRRRASYLILSVGGAVAHNLAQLLVVSLLYTAFVFWAYLPILIVFGVLAGTATAVLLRLLMPALTRWTRRFGEK